MIHNSRRNQKKQKGITLVALVVTMVILIILATVTISATLGENGLIKQAKKTKDLANNFISKEESDMNKLLQEYANMMAEDSKPPLPEDTTPPTVNIIVGEVTENSIAVTVNASDDSGKVVLYKYYLNGTEKAITESNSYTFTGLTAGTQYTIKVEAFDKANNKGENTTTVNTTKKETIGDIVGGDQVKDNTEIEDDLGNKVWIPGGFGVAEDSGTKVEDGIVIEDSKGNQFVWIPTGTYKTTSGNKTNNLSRRTFTSSKATEVTGDNVIGNYYYGEGNSNSIANSTIGAFKTSVKTKGGFYIGRFEQGEGNVCKRNVIPYDNITRDQANTQAKIMYNENIHFVSELISSYAWDTALNFICQTNSSGYKLAVTNERGYGNIGTDNKTNTGMYVASEYSKINDMIGNLWEWTTEYCSMENLPYTVRSRSLEISK